MPESAGAERGVGVLLGAAVGCGVCDLAAWLASSPAAKSKAEAARVIAG